MCAVSKKERESERERGTERVCVCVASEILVVLIIVILASRVANIISITNDTPHFPPSYHVIKRTR